MHKKLLIVVFILISCVFVNATGSVPIRKASLKKISASALPSLNYGSAKTFFVGGKMATLAPASSGVGSFGYNTVPITLGSGFANPQYIKISKNGDLYVADQQNKTVSKIAANNGAVTLAGTGYQGPRSAAIDAAGNLFINDASVLELAAGTNTPFLIDGSYGADIIVDTNGNVYFTDISNRAVKEILAQNGGVINIPGEYSSPSGIALDAAGNIYVADLGTYQITKIPHSGGVAQIIASNFINAKGLTVDNAGNVYVSAMGTNTITKIPADGGSPVALNPAINNCNGVAIDEQGNLYTSSTVGGAVIKKISPSGGYFITPALPAGLSFDSNTGIISGIPTVLTPATKYTVTAYNQTGKTSSSFTITTALQPISYPGPDVFVAGKAITALSPTAGNVGPVGYGNAKNIGGTGFSQPQQLAIDSGGNIYVADVYHNVIKKIIPGNSNPVTLGAVFNMPYGVSVDHAGNLYVADQSNTVKKIAVGTNAVTVIGTGFNSPAATAVDADGNVYVADELNGAVKKISASTGAIVSIGSGFSKPVGVAVDGNNNIYVSDNGTGKITKMPPGGGTPVIIATGINAPAGLTVDFSGNVYYCWAGSQIAKIPASGGSPVIINSGFDELVGIVIDPAGVITAGDGFGISSLTPTGGYYVHSPLPKGLVINNTTGVISGTPLAATLAANYFVTGYYDVGGTSAKINITVNPSPDALLTKLAINSGTTLTNVTSTTGYKNYTTSVPYSTNTIQVTATAKSTSAIIKINGVTTASNAPSANIILAIGSTTINTIVTAPDGSTANYVITVTRAGSDNALLSKLTTSTGIPLTTINGSDYRDYTMTVPGSTSTITITPVAQDANASVKVDGVITASGNASAPITLAIGKTVINTVVTAQDGITRKSYVLTVTRLSSNALLTKLTNSTSITPTTVTGPDYRDYTLSVANSVSSITVTPTTQDVNATVKVNGTTVASGSASQSIALAVGTTVISTVVTAQDGVTTNTYKITVTRAAALSNNALLTKLTNSTGITQTTVSGPDYRDYTLSVANSISSVTVTPTAQESHATIKVNGTTVASGSASQSIALAVGQTVISTVVTAQDGTTTNTYKITVTRAAASMAMKQSFDQETATPVSDGLVVHQGVTPNNDGINDVFTIDGLSNYPDNKVTIITRGGTVVYEAKGYDNQTKAFDGHSSKTGAKQLPGTYFYMLEYTANGKTKNATGYIVLKY